jgi:hypothetical protein
MTDQSEKASFYPVAPPLHEEELPAVLNEFRNGAWAYLPIAIIGIFLPLLVLGAYFFRKL